MALGNRVKTDALTTVYDSEVYPLGTYFVQQADEVVGDDSLEGDRTWLFIESEGITANALLRRSSTSSSFKVADSAASNATELLNLAGVANHAIASGKYGWIVVRGETTVLNAATVAAGNNLISTSGAAGKCKPATGGATDSFAVFGRALTAQTGAGAVKVFVDFRA